MENEASLVVKRGARALQGVGARGTAAEADPATRTRIEQGPSGCDCETDARVAPARLWPDGSPLWKAQDIHAGDILNTCTPHTSGPELS